MQLGGMQVGWRAQAGASSMGKRPLTTHALVTAGFRWAPEIARVEYAASATDTPQMAARPKVP